MSEVDAFKRTLKELSSLGINPVTIPQWLGIKHISNLLNGFYKQLELEESIAFLEQLRRDDPKTFRQIMRGQF